MLKLSYIVNFIQISTNDIKKVNNPSLIRILYFYSVRNKIKTRNESAFPCAFQGMKILRNIFNFIPHFAGLVASPRHENGHILTKP